MKCNYCGNDIPYNNKFCSSCGAQAPQETSKAESSGNNKPIKIFNVRLQENTVNYYRHRSRYHNITYKPVKVIIEKEHIIVDYSDGNAIRYPFTVINKHANNARLRNSLLAFIPFIVLLIVFFSNFINMANQAGSEIFFIVPLVFLLIIFLQTIPNISRSLKGVAFNVIDKDANLIFNSVNEKKEFLELITRLQEKTYNRYSV